AESVVLCTTRAFSHASSLLCVKKIRFY
ncbi:putative nADH pyrophosphatase, partial [Vibrio parahaemolyticus 10296]